MQARDDQSNFSNFSKRVVIDNLNTNERAKRELQVKGTSRFRIDFGAASKELLYVRTKISKIDFFKFSNPNKKFSFERKYIIDLKFGLVQQY